MTDTFSAAQLAQIEASMRKVVREELGDIGLRVDSPDHQEVAREDLRFLRRLRQGVDGAASKLGWLVIAAIASGVVSLVGLGLNVWRIGK